MLQKLFYDMIFKLTQTLHTTEQLHRCLDDYVLDQFIEGLRDQTAADVISAIPDLNLKKALDYFIPDKKILKQPLNDSELFNSPKKNSKVGMIPVIKRESSTCYGIPRGNKIFVNGREDHNDGSLLNEFDFEPNFTLNIMCNDCDFEAPSEQALSRHVSTVHHHKPI